ncbi:MAG: thioredoxin family protein [Candidatus Bathyarchaeia archaeon]
MRPILMPELNSVKEGKILEWGLSEGEKFEAQEPLFLVEAGDTVLEVQAPQSGTLLKILAPVGTTVKATDSVALYAEEGEQNNWDPSSAAKDTSIELRLKDLDKKVVLRRFEENLKDEVEIAVFGRHSDCRYYDETLQLMQETVTLSPKIKVTVYDFDQNPDAFKQFRVDRMPALIVQSRAGGRIRYFGFPAGYLYKVLLDDIIWTSRGSSDLTESSKAMLQTLTKATDVLILTTGRCGSCLKMMKVTHQAVIENPHINVDIVDVEQFPDALGTHPLVATPLTIINNKTKVLGALDEERTIARVLETQDN